eukprot:159-Rhodomonas_salina.2
MERRGRGLTEAVRARPSSGCLRPPSRLSAFLSAPLSRRHRTHLHKTHRMVITQSVFDEGMCAACWLSVGHSGESGAACSH